MSPIKKPIDDADRPPQRPVDEAPHVAHDDESNWLVSYADMMTLLCGFFIMLFSMAKLDTPQYDSFKETLSKQFGGEYSSPTKELAKFATEIIQELGVEEKAIVKRDHLGVSVVFESAVFFETLSSEVSIQGKAILSQFIEKIGQRQKDTGKTYNIVIEGHTDSRPIIGGVYPSNWELSGARAARVVRMFLEKGFSADRLTAIGYADTHPQVPNRSPSGEWDEAALGKNRRVVLRILEPNVDSIPFPDKETTPAVAPPKDAPPAVNAQQNIAH